ncbi:hypothetical protein ACHWQZ_G013484 [Mnemiopsis leidyi]
MNMSGGGSMVMEPNNMTSGGMNHQMPDNSAPEMKMMDGHMMPANDSIAMMMMQMTFYAGVDCTVLINQWKTSNAGQLLGTAIFWFVVAVLHQGTKRLRRCLLNRRGSRAQRAGTFTKLDDNETTPIQSPETEIVNSFAMDLVKEYMAQLYSPSSPPSGWQKMTHHILQSVLQLLQTTTSYLLMLVFMTYNVWLAVAIVLGDMCGYMIFCYDMPDLTGGCG